MKDTELFGNVNRVGKRILKCSSSLKASNYECFSFKLIQLFENFIKVHSSVTLKIAAPSVQEVNSINVLKITVAFI